MSHDNRVKFLFNPFTKKQVQLPQRECFVKAILSSTPSHKNLNTGNCVVVALYADIGLAACRPGDGEWMIPELPGVMDMIFSKGLLYCVTEKKEIIVYNSFGPHLQFEEIDRLPRLEKNDPSSDEQPVYLVESKLGILLVLRHYY